MNVFIIGVAHKSGKGLLASPAMEKELHLLGIEPVTLETRDDVQLEQAFRQAQTAGGLALAPLTGNPQIDSLISENVARACGVPLELHQQAAEQIARSNRKLTRAEVASMAALPRGARIFPDHTGEIPGYQINGQTLQVLVLPADPVEQCGIFFSSIFPTFAHQQKYPCASHILRVMGLSAPEVEGALKDILGSQNPCVAVYPRRDEVAVRISARAQDHQQAANASITAMKTALERLGSYVYGVDVQNIEQALMQRLEKKNLKLAVAEAGTGSQAGHRLSKCGGEKHMSFYFTGDKGSVSQDLGIPEKLIEKNGVVSRQTAGAMAAAAASKGQNVIGVGITLPTAKDKSASAYAAASCGDQILVEEIPVSGFRSVNQLMESCVTRALNLARKFADSYPAAPKGVIPVAEALAAGAAAAEPVKKGSAAVDKTAGKGKKKSLGKRILGAIFPQKGESTSEKMRKVGILLCLCVFCGSMGYLLNHHQQGVNAGKTTEKLNDMLSQAESGQLEVDQEKLDKVAPEVLEKYKPFVALNEDTKGWIKIPDTNVSYPVVQAKDNDFYLRKGFDGEYDYYGVPYLDYECSIDVDDVSDHLIVYGHNIGNDGLMFNPVSYYKQLDFYKTHPTVQFDSIYSEGQYKIFGVFLANAQPEQDNGVVFHYQRYVDFEDEAQFNEFVNEVRRRSMWDIDVDVQPGDKLLTLSTCTYDFRPDERCVVVARKVREGEEATVDTSTAKVNEDAYYPQAYYDAMKEKAKYGKVKGITIDGAKEHTISVGETLQLKAITDPADAPINTATWDSSAPAVATVDPRTGLVTAVTPGEVNITAMADDGGWAATVKVIVKAKNALEYIGLDPDELTMQVGQEQKITTIVTPEDAAVNLEWFLDEGHAEGYLAMSVNKSNPKEMYVKALKATGNTPITLTVKDKTTGKTATSTIYITDQASLTGMRFQYETYSMQVNETKTAQINVLPDGAVIPANTQIHWQVQDESVVKLANTTLSYSKAVTKAANSITGLKPGTTTLRASVTVGGETFTAECQLVVADANITITAINPNPLTLQAGASAALNVAVNPISGTSAVTAESNNDLVTVEKVNDNGNGTLTFNVTAGQKGGQDTIVFYANGKKAGTCEVTVGGGTVALTGVALNPGAVTLDVGGTQDIQATATPEGAKIEKYEWSSSDSSVASVNGNGTVTAVKAGTATIKLVATDAQGNKATGTMTVTVKAAEVTPPPKEEITISGSTELTVGGSGALSASGAAKYTWTSSDDSIVTVDQNGNLVAVGEGTVNITVTGPNGGSATIKVTVKPAPEPEPKPEPEPEPEPTPDPEEPTTPPETPTDEGDKEAEEGGEGETLTEPTSPTSEEDPVPETSAQ